MDFESLWMPFTANRYFKQHPKLLHSASGMHYQDTSGRKILDGTAGLWCCNAGHSQPLITEAIQQSAATLDYAPGFQLGHPLAFRLATKLSALAPKDLNRVFFTNSGSESVDSALKIALAYHQATGDTSRTLLVGRERGYHGVGFGGISVGGLPNNKKHFQLLPNVAHLPHTHVLEKNAFSKGLPAWGQELASSLALIQEQSGKIAAVIVEPIAGSTGVLLPPKGYLAHLRKLCDDLGALLIFDEVITGFGRIGGPFAASHFDVIPDIITSAKGLTNGSVPMGAVIVRQSIYDAVVDSAASGQIEFFHGYTYSGHPLACSAALATLEVYQSQGLYDKAQTLNDYFCQKAHRLKELPHVIDIRQYGLVAGIELSSRKDAPGARAMAVFHRCFELGVLIRVTGDIIALSPPLIIERSHIDELFSILSQVLQEVA